MRKSPPDNPLASLTMPDAAEHFFAPAINHGRIMNSGSEMKSSNGTSCVHPSLRRSFFSRSHVVVSGRCVYMHSDPNACWLKRYLLGMNSMYGADRIETGRMCECERGEGSAGLSQDLREKFSV